MSKTMALLAELTVTLVLCTSVITADQMQTSNNASKTEAFFQGSCEKWNPCSQMCLNVPNVGGLECRCAVGYTLNADGFTCDELAQPSSTLPPQYHDRDAAESAHIQIVHFPGKHQRVEEAAREDMNSLESGSRPSSLGGDLLKHTSDITSDKNKYMQMNRQDINSMAASPNLGSDNTASKRWGYGNYYKTQPSNYYSSNSGLNNQAANHLQSNYYGYLADSPYYKSTYNKDKQQTKNRVRPSSRRKNGKGKGRKGKGKGRKNKPKNKIDYDVAQSDSSAAITSSNNNNKFTSAADISNNVLPDEDYKSSYMDSKPAKYESCNSLNCKNGGKCVPDDMLGGVRCQCKLGNEGDQCEHTVLVKYPQFRGFGYMAFPVLRGAYREFNITIEFRPDTLNGLLLFSAEHPNARNDFFSIALIDEKVEFRYDCGTGMVVIGSSNRVKLGEWNTVTVHRKDWKGMLTLNNGPQAAGRSPGFFHRITFREDLFLGGYKNLSLIGPRTGMQWGYVGCVRLLSINDKSYDMRKGQYVGDAIYGVDVGECSTHTCDHVDCLNGGRCEADSADTSVCLCPVGAVGDRCESKLDIYIPSFDGTSYLQFLGLRRRVLMFTKIEIVFKASDNNGLILYNGYRTDRTGDFISVALVNGYLEFRFDLGTGPAVIKSRNPITLNKWHTVRLERTGRHGEVVVDNEAAVSGMAEGAYTQLTLTLDLFIGGHRNFDEVGKLAQVNSAFKGCIQKIVINDEPMKLLEDYIHGVNIDNCDHPCMGQPCMNGGRCLPVGEKYQCSCPLGFENTNCEDSVSSSSGTKKMLYKWYSNATPIEAHEPVTIPNFNGGSFLKYDDNEVMRRVKGSKLEIEMRIRPTGPNGLLFWTSEDVMSPNSDYLAVGLDNGHAILRYNLGSGDVVISFNGSRLDDGKWHRIKAQRSHKLGYLEIDGEEGVESNSPGNLKQLNVDNTVYIGGMPSDSLAHKTLKKFTSGFQGCIANVTLATDYKINLMHDVIDGENIKQCSSIS